MALNQPSVNSHHDCNFFGQQRPFARQDSLNVAAVSVHTKDHAIKNFLSDVSFGHAEDVHGHAPLSAGQELAFIGLLP